MESEDRKYRDLAYKFYNEMMANMPDILHKGYESSVIKGEDVMEGDFSDLYVVFSVKSGNSQAGFGRAKDRKAIVIYDVGNANTPSFSRTAFIHEFIHYLDSKRAVSKLSTAKPENVGLIKYYNSPMEYNAYYQEIYFIDRLLETEQGRKFLGKMDYNKFFDWITKNVFEKGFVENMTKDTERRLRKRLYSYYMENIANI